MPGFETFSSDEITADLLKVAADLQKEAGIKQIAQSLVAAFAMLVGQAGGEIAAKPSGTQYKILEREHQTGYEKYILQQGNTVITAVCPLALDDKTIAEMHNDGGEATHRLQILQDLDYSPAVGAYFEQLRFSCDIDVGTFHALIGRGHNALFLEDGLAVVPLQITGEKLTQSTSKLPAESIVTVSKTSPRFSSYQQVKDQTADGAFRTGTDAKLVQYDSTGKWAFIVMLDAQGRTAPGADYSPDRGWIAASAIAKAK